MERGECSFKGGRLLDRPDTDLMGDENDFGEIPFADMYI